MKDNYAWLIATMNEIHKTVGQVMVIFLPE